MNYKLYNKSLNPKLWEKIDEKYALRPDVREALLNIADDFVNITLKEKKIKVKADEIILVGSSANYNWTEFSDLDLHIVVDFDQLNMPESDAEVLFDAIKSNWNKDHDIKIKGLDVELYVQNGVDEVDSLAIYSIKNDKWLQYPKVENPQFNKKIIRKKHAEFKRQIEALLKSNGSDVESNLKKLLEKLYKFRQAGLDKNGEFSEENIVFKILRAQGYIDKMKKITKQIYDRENSLKESLDVSVITI
jgi:predicted nucleotidyltransferase